MNSRIAIFGCFLTALFSESAFAVETPPRRLEGEAPKYDGFAIQLFQEGWVHLEAKITVAGTVEDVKVLTSYPKGRFDDEAIKAIKTWKFAPKIVDGIPTEEPAYRCGIQFVIEGKRGVSEDYIKYFNRALGALRARNIPDSEKFVGRLRELFDNEKFNLTEIARFYQFEARLAANKHDYLAAADWIERALSLSQFLDNKEVVDNLHLQMIVSFANLTQPAFPG